MFYVYVLFRPNGVPCYIGKGTGTRWRQHFSSAYNPHLKNIIAKAGGELPAAIIRDRLTENEAFDTERALIAAIGREIHGGPLVNMTDGGDGSSGHVKSEKERQRISQLHRGRKRPPETGKRIQAKMLGRVFSDETRAKMSAAWRYDQTKTDAMRQANLGRVLSEETRRKIGDANRKHSHKQSPETRAKIAAGMKAHRERQRVEA